MKDYFYKVTLTRFYINLLPALAGFTVLAIKYDHIVPFIIVALCTSLADALYMLYDKSKQDN